MTRNSVTEASALVCSSRLRSILACLERQQASGKFVTQADADTARDQALDEIQTLLNRLGMQHVSSTMQSIRAWGQE